MKFFIYVEPLGPRYLTRVLCEDGTLYAEALSTARAFCEKDIRRAEERLRLAGEAVECVHDVERHEGLQKALKLEGGK